MNFYLLLLACALEAGPASPGSAAEEALEAQLRAGQQAEQARLHLEALEEVLTQETLSAQDLRTIRAELERAKAAQAEAEQALLDAEAALAVPGGSLSPP